MTGTAAASTPTALFDYVLPSARIAQEPPADRDASRLLHLRSEGGLEDRHFTDLPDLLRAGDLLVVNDTRVRAARLRAVRAGGGTAEVLLLNRLEGGGGTGARFGALVRPNRRLPAGSVLTVRAGEGLVVVVGEALSGHPGARAVTVCHPDGGDVEAAIAEAGSVPLPPYIHRRLADPERYQTVFGAGVPAASAAAPTAGLHFSQRVLDALGRRGVELCRVRLDVGLGTFAPIRAETIEAHVIHEERFDLPAAAAAAVAAARGRGARVVAVGTTAARVLETRRAGGGLVSAGSGSTNLYLRPGHPPRVIDGLITNFHQPRSSLLVLLASLVGERWRAAYDHALRSDYRFLSFGDCMLAWAPGASTRGGRG